MLLEFKNISKQFGESRVLKEVSLGLRKGKILGLVGENGAGKSTLMNILGGVFPPTAGTMYLNGQLFLPLSPREALQRGIAFIHQELNLFSNLNIVDNIFLNHFPLKKIGGISIINRREAIDRTQKMLRQVGLEISPKKRVEQLTPAQKQLVEIAKALSASPHIVIFDEPTTSLTRHEAQKLYELIGRLKSQNIGMIYISHNLDEVVRLADQIAVLRDGKLIRIYDSTTGYNLQPIIHDIVGRELDRFYPERTTKPEDEIILQVKNVSAGNVADKISFSIKKKEVLGFYGLIGAGRSEIARMIYGLDYFEKGDVIYRDQPVISPSPAGWIKLNVAFLTEDRMEEGLLMDQNIQKNVQLAGLPKFTSRPFNRIDYSKAGAGVRQQVRATKVVAQSLTNQLVSTLSGGNQQKVVLAKWLLTEPELLILDEPTKGIDIGAKQEIYRLVNGLVEKGSSILLISSEIEELMGLCDRILVMNRGRICAEFRKEEFNQTAILEAALHRDENKPNTDEHFAE